MKKKQLVLTSAMAATLATLSACSSQEDDWDSDVVADRETAVCVDQNGNRIADDNCDRQSYRGGGGVGTAFLWYYLGRGSRIPYYGDSVYDKNKGYRGSKTATAGANYSRAPASTSMTRSAAIARGGFGSSGRSYGGGRS